MRSAIDSRTRGKQGPGDQKILVKPDILVQSFMVPGLSTPTFLLLVALPLRAQCTVEIATVVDLKGNWTDQARKNILTRKQMVCAESQVQRANDAHASPTDFLKLASRGDSRQITLFECKALLGCERPLDLSALIGEERRRLRGSNLLESFVSWRNSHDRMVTTMSRLVPPAGVPVLRTSVVQAGESIRAADVFIGDAPPREYSMDLCDASTDEVCGKTLPLPKKVVWRPGAGGDLPFGPLPEGVHILYRLQDDDPEIRTKDRVLLVAVHPSHAGLIPEARDKIAIAARSVSPDDPDRSTAFEDYVRFIAARLMDR
jgi:hypothetical protein